MDAHDRLMGMLRGEKVDHVPVFASDRLRVGPQGGWTRRLIPRGLGLIHIVPAYKPWFSFPASLDVCLDGIVTTSRNYVENGVRKSAYLVETPIGSLRGITQHNGQGVLADESPQEYFVKRREDWRIVNYIVRRVTDALAPNHRDLTLEADALGGNGIAIAVVEKTPFQRAWIELGALDRVAIDFAEQPDELMEFLETQQRFHGRAAEIASESPAEVVLIIDNVTDVISPRYYRRYCQPYYETYARALHSTGKLLACHLDGKLAHLKAAIAESPIDIIDSLTVPPVGNLSLRDSRAAWPGKAAFVNCPPHLAWAQTEELRAAYAGIAEEWGDGGLAIAHIEDLPLESVERHLSAALDAYGY